MSYAGGTPKPKTPGPKPSGPKAFFTDERLVVLIAFAAGIAAAGAAGGFVAHFDGPWWSQLAVAELAAVGVMLGLFEALSAWLRRARNERLCEVQDAAVAAHWSGTCGCTLPGDARGLRRVERRAAAGGRGRGRCPMTTQEMKTAAGALGAALLAGAVVAALTPGGLAGLLLTLAAGYLSFFAAWDALAPRPTKAGEDGRDGGEL
ncbi:hypothetical protein ACIQWA_40585 [Kitasatospora sp. NPDC098652]|uniref:hypothetical protein n=1 Tax=Kitasatospora sp. NPDC098652 TaxID=3364095 RepID=UPI0038041E4F